MRGKGVTKDEKKAVKWIRLSAEQGVLAAMVELAQLYEKGIGVSKNEKEAALWHRLMKGHL